MEVYSATISACTANELIVRKIHVSQAVALLGMMNWLQLRIQCPIHPIRSPLCARTKRKASPFQKCITFHRYYEACNLAVIKFSLFCQSFPVPSSRLLFNLITFQFMRWHIIKSGSYVSIYKYLVTLNLKECLNSKHSMQLRMGKSLKKHVNQSLTSLMLHYSHCVVFSAWTVAPHLFLHVIIVIIADFSVYWCHTRKYKSHV